MIDSYLSRVVRLFTLASILALTAGCFFTPDYAELGDECASDLNCKDLDICLPNHRCSEYCRAPSYSCIFPFPACDHGEDGSYGICVPCVEDADCAFGICSRAQECVAPLVALIDPDLSAPALALLTGEAPQPGFATNPNATLPWVPICRALQRA